MIKGVLIDLGKTVLTNRIIDFEKGISAIYQISDKKMNYQEYYNTHLKLYNITFKYLHRFNLEMRISDYLNSLNELTNITINKTNEEIEDIFLENIVSEELILGIEDLLKYFNSLNIPVIAVSNSCISGRALSKELEEFKILKYFKKVISSADTYVRKPKKEIFDYAVNYLKMITNDLTIKNDEIIFIGNDYECDVIGAKNIGLSTVWFNQERKDDIYNLCDINIATYNELLDIMKKYRP